MEDRDGPILTAPLCLNFHTLLSHYKRIGTNRSDTEDTGEKRRGEETREEQSRGEGFQKKKSNQSNIKMNEGWLKLDL